MPVPHPPLVHSPSETGLGHTPFLEPVPWRSPSRRLKARCTVQLRCPTRVDDGGLCADLTVATRGRRQRLSTGCGWRMAPRGGTRAAGADRLDTATPAAPTVDGRPIETAERDTRPRQLAAHLWCRKYAVSVIPDAPRGVCIVSVHPPSVPGRSSDRRYRALTHLHHHFRGEAGPRPPVRVRGGAGRIHCNQSARRGPAGPYSSERA